MLVSVDICSSPVCDRVVLYRGLCKTHYERQRRGEGVDRPIRSKRPDGLALADALAFSSSKLGVDECWPWNGSVDKKGYGRFELGSDTWKSHRAAWTLAYGPIPPGKVIRHDCDNPRCVNPSHLRIGTHADNVADKVERERCNRGEEHPRAVLTEELVVELRRRYAAGESVRVISATMGFEYETIRGAAIRRTWKHVH
jgi:hypothetical protein